MIQIKIIISILILHLVGDFFFQTDWMAINKSKRFSALFLHGIFYSIPFLCFGLFFTILNGSLHILIDFISSKVTTKLFEINERHWFFVVIGIDQCIHYCCLFLSYYFIFS